MYNPYRINGYRLRKLAALNTLYKLAKEVVRPISKVNLKQNPGDAVVIQEEVAKALGPKEPTNTLYNVPKHKGKTSKSKRPANFQDIQRRGREAGRAYQAFQPKPVPKATDLLKALRESTAKNKQLTGSLSNLQNELGVAKGNLAKAILKGRIGTGVGAGLGALGIAGTAFEGYQSHKNRKALAKALASLETSNRGLGAAQRRIRQLENRGFFDYLFGRNK